MSLAYYIVLNPEIVGFDAYVNGKALANADQQSLAKICQTLGVRPLEEFLSQNADELAEFLEDEDIEAPNQLEAEQWFSAEDGLATVHALSKYLSENPKALKKVSAIREELDEYAAVLERVKQEKVQWHLAIDF